jgi:hypothetical protein
MSSISLEAFDGELRGKLSQWILPNDICALPNGFQDQLMSGTNPFQTHILLTTKQESKAWLLAYSWDLTYMPETSTDWSLLLSILAHLKKPILIVTTPKCSAPSAFWQKCATLQPAPTCTVLSEISDSPKQSITPPIPNTAFFPKLDSLTEAQFIKAQYILHPVLQQTIQKLDLRSLYRELRGAGASLCLSTINSRTISDLSFNSMWFYPEINGALRLQVSDLRMILRTVTERLAEP